MQSLPVALSPDEKRAAVARVLQSRTLGRAEQLRTMLRYICDAELEGKAHELNEYALGVFALGRPADYSPAEDSCVRSRAHELRHRLDTYYQSEAPADPIRIQIAKGGYVPRFVRADHRSTDPTGLAPESGLRDDVLVRFWTPFLGGPMLIAFDVRLFFFAPNTGLVVRDYQTNEASAQAQSQPLERFKQRMDEPDLVETRDYADFGSVHAAFLLGRMLGTRGSDVGLKHATALDMHDLWNSNVVFLGKATTNPIVRQLLDDRAFVTDEDGVIYNRYPRDGEAEVYKCASTHGFGEKYALITKLRGPQVGRHVLVLSGCGAELIWALAETVTNPLQVADIMEHIAPNGELPDEFEIVIQATFHGNVPARIRCVAHRAG